MKLTKQTEAELLQAYYDFWASNLSANMEVFSSYLVDDFSIFGSANGEVFFNKQDAVKFYTATADEMRGKAELRNRNISVQPLDTNSIIVREESDLYGFNAAMKTDFENGIGNINIIPQDIGRVIRNLITNAFYSVNEKQKSGVENYEPTITVSTRKSGSKIMISVKDNGNGIPKHIKEKIFQPFFTTKPTGQGTGLGLSLSYDIVKAHGGEIKVETKEGEGSEFIILIP